MTEQRPQQLVTVLTPDDLVLEWQDSALPSDSGSRHLQEKTFRQAHTQPDLWLFHLGFAPETAPLPESLAFWRRWSAGFVSKLALTPQLEQLRDSAEVPPSLDELRPWVLNAPPFPGREHLDVDRALALWEQLNEAFRRVVRAHEGTVESLLHSLRPDLELAGRVFFHLVENKKNDRSPFAFLATYSTRIADGGTARHVPLKNALSEYKGHRDKLLELLSTVHKAARKSRLITDLVESGRIFHPVAFDQNAALTFLKETPNYEAAGVRCRIPNWWTARTSRVSLHLSVGERTPSALGIDALVECSPRIMVGGEEMSPRQIAALLEETSGLVLIKNRWVEVDRARLEKTLDVYRKAQALVEGGVTMREAMRLLLNPEEMLEGAGDEVEVRHGQWLAETVRKLTNPAIVRNVAPGERFRARLRAYQQHGLNWLALLDSLGFGACLADDMGLGKTVQTLAFLSAVRDRAREPSLLVLPASLIGNWCDEIQRFLPDLNTLVFHGSTLDARTRSNLTAEELKRHDLVVTTYGIVHRDAWLRDIDWHYVILDEAQAIKNPAARQTRAVKKLRSRNRMALTGTPVENRLSDLWSIFDFLNPGLLGSRREFKDRAKGLQNSADGYARLRRVVSPYILRRLKTDKTIIDDLPDKVEVRSYAELTHKQVVLYEDMVADLKEMLEDAEGVRRRGIVLSALMKFKQICNHPDQYVGAGGYREADSGKFLRLREIAETIAAKRERALVFTQFREIIEPLHGLLCDVFGRPGRTLHGGVAVKKRQKLVDEFQTSREYIPCIVLSVRAAGVGLNLSRANHVIHFDRWWNPAVENQATDRAFRIGQTRNVLVHKFVTRGTVEEKIDRMIEEKKELSDRLVSASSGESWVTELDDRRLLDLFSLPTGNA